MHKTAEMRDEKRVPRSPASGLPMIGLCEQMKLPISSLNNQPGILPFTPMTHSTSIISSNFNNIPSKPGGVIMSILQMRKSSPEKANLFPEVTQLVRVELELISETNSYREWQVLCLGTHMHYPTPSITQRHHCHTRLSLHRGNRGGIC